MTARKDFAEKVTGLLQVNWMADKALSLQDENVYQHQAHRPPYVRPSSEIM